MPTGSATRARRAAGDPTTVFFDDLAARGHEPYLEGASGSIRFDLADGRTIEHWYVKVSKGDVGVSKKDGKADTVVRVDKAFFDRLTQGRENAMAATLRGVLVAQGDLGLVLLFQRIFPGPPGSRARARKSATEEGRQ
jgi:SCP-2 sterol transfer family